MSRYSNKLAAAVSTISYLALAVSANAATSLPAPSGAVSTLVDVNAVPQLVINLLFLVASFLAVAYLMYGGIKWITSRGDKVGVEAARKHIVAAIIGIIIVAGSFFIMQTIFTILGADNPLQKGFTLPKLSPST